MITSVKQNTAKEWSKALIKLNASQPGQVQIAYQDEQGNKQVGYVDLFELEIVDGDKSVKLGDMLISLQTSINTAVANEKTLKAENQALREHNTKLDGEIGELMAHVFPDYVRI
jgi:hypothetical protein